MRELVCINSVIRLLVLFYYHFTNCYSSYSPFSVFTSDFFSNSRDSALKNMRVIHSWKTIDFVFPSSSKRSAMIKTGDFIPENSIILDADFWQDGLEDKIFVTLPRMREGIPVTLAKISHQTSLDGSAKLQPYPDWSWQKEDNCEGMVSAFRMKIDDCGNLWVIDSGITDVLHSQHRTCSPKLMVFDLHSDKLMLKYVFPEDVLENTSLLVTIAIDSRSRHCTDTFAYVADVTEFGLIVFDSKTRRSWRVNSNFFYPFPLFGTFKVAGSEFDLMDGIIGLALGPLDGRGDKTLYFHSLASVRESKVSTSFLRNASNFLHGENKVSKDPKSGGETRTKISFPIGPGWENSSKKGMPDRVCRVKRAEEARLLEEHMSKPLHSVFFRHIRKEGLSTELTFSLLRRGGFREETKGFVMAAWDGVCYTFYISDEVRTSQSAAQDMSDTKILFFGLLSHNSVACWNSRLPYLSSNIVTVAHNNTTLQFPSGVKIVKKNGNEELLVTSSRFSSYFLKKLSAKEINFRILSATVEDLIQGTACDYKIHPFGFSDAFFTHHKINVWR